MWMYTLGVYIIDDDHIVPPFSDMALTLAYIIVPIGIGLAINKFIPKVGRAILKPQKLVLVFTILFVIILGK